MMVNIIIFILLMVILGILVLVQEFDNFGGFIEIKGESMGFFYMQEIDGCWWLVILEGYGFFGIGFSYLVIDFFQGVVMFFYRGDQEVWLCDGIRKMWELGYNCVWSGLYSMECIWFGYVDYELVECVYCEEEIFYVIYVLLIKYQVEL